MRSRPRLHRCRDRAGRPAVGRVRRRLCRDLREDRRGEHPRQRGPRWPLHRWSAARQVAGRRTAIHRSPGATRTGRADGEAIVMSHSQLSRRLLAVAAAATAVAATVLPAGAATAPTAPRIGHLFVIELENKGYDETFGATAPPYLAKKLPAQGALLTQYYATGHASLDNYITQVSGQAPNMYT